MAEEKKLPMIVKTVEKSGFMEIKLRDLQNNSEWVHRDLNPGPPPREGDVITN